MGVVASRRDRYLSDPLPVRLGGIAANLARVRSFSVNPLNRQVIWDLLEESKWFIEWSAPEAEIETAAELVVLQVQLAGWQRGWREFWEDEVWRQQLAQRAKVASDRVLALSGLLDQA